MQHNLSSAPELAGRAIFNFCGKFRYLIGILAIAALSVISITFNYRLGQIMGSDDVTTQLFPIGFAALDLSALFLAAWLTIKSRSYIRKGLAWLWLGLLVCLSVWAAMSFTLASDAQLKQQSNLELLAYKEKQLIQADKQVQVAQENYENTNRFKNIRLGQLQNAQANREAIYTDIAQLKESTPPPGLAIYTATSALLYSAGFSISAEFLSSIVRMVWALALTISPFILTGLLAFEIANSAPPSPLKKKPLTPAFTGENEAKKPENTGLRLVKSEGKIQGKSTVNITSADYKKAAEYVSRVQGRVKRDAIRTKCSNKSYDAVSAMIELLLKKGDLNRVGNGQLISANRLKIAN